MRRPTPISRLSAYVILLLVGSSTVAIAGADQSIASLSVQLLHASDPDHAQALAEQLEQLRLSRLAPTTRLLLRRGQREIEGGKLNEAIGDLDDAIELQPDQAPLWRERAIIRAAQGNTDAAITDLGGALSRDQTDAAAWSTLSRIEESGGRNQPAYEAWEHVLRLDPMITGGAARLDHLRRRMLGDPT